MRIWRWKGLRDNVLTCENVTFGYTKRLPILCDASISVAPGEVVWLQGPSGVGKTTLCHVLAGYLQPQVGRVLIDEKPLPMQGCSPVQYIGQHPEDMLDPRMRMADSLAEGGACAPDLLDHLDIRQEWMTRFPHELSGGELQRFCIARALAANPRYLVADEISTMLDALTQARIWHVMRDEVETRGVGLLLTTHSEALGELLATRVVRMEEL